MAAIRRKKLTLYLLVLAGLGVVLSLFFMLGPPKLLANGSKPGERPKQLDAAWLDDLVKTGAKVAVWNDQVSKEAVKQAHQRGLKVWVYTINDPSTANKLLDLGVDGIITNNTGLLWRTLALRAMQ